MIDVKTFTCTIANGASLSDTIQYPNSTAYNPLQLGSLSVTGIVMPASWTAANLTFQLSNDGTNFFDVYDNNGVELTVTSAASRFIIIPPTLFLTGYSLKIRSGTSGTPVNQGGTRSLTILARFFT